MPLLIHHPATYNTKHKGYLSLEAAPENFSKCKFHDLAERKVHESSACRLLSSSPPHRETSHHPYEARAWNLPNRLTETCPKIHLCFLNHLRTVTSISTNTEDQRDTEQRLGERVGSRSNIIINRGGPTDLLSICHFNIAKEKYAHLQHRTHSHVLQSMSLGLGPSSADRSFTNKEVRLKSGVLIALLSRRALNKQLPPLIM